MVTRYNSKLDLNHDGYTDLLFRSWDGHYGVWNIGADGVSIIGASLVDKPTGDATPLAVALSGNPLWEDTTGHVVPPDSSYGSPFYYATPTAIGDFNGDGTLDFYYAAVASGAITSAYTMEASLRKIPANGTGTIADPAGSWSFVGVGDFNHDKVTDVLLRGLGPSAGAFAIEEMPGSGVMFGNIQPAVVTFADPGSYWNPISIADFNGDGYADILWQGQGGEVGIWIMRGSEILEFPIVYGAQHFWQPVATGDYNNDGKSDILWEGADGTIGEWLMNGAQFAGLGLVTHVPPGWDLAVF